MLYTHFTEKILGLQDVIITNIEDNGKELTLYAELKRKEHTCPCCGKKTDKVHDYRKQGIRDISAFGKAVTLVLKKRRYCCPDCKKRFFEENSFLPRYYRRTSRLTAYIIEKLRSECSFSSVARELNISVTTVIRTFDLVSYSKAKVLPAVLSIDEFKGNTGKEKYQCILTDPDSGVVLDILPKRYEHYLTGYFKEIPKAEREKVKYFVSDMWKPYTGFASAWLKNAVQVVDKYHWIRQVIWAFEKVRKEEQSRFSKDYRKYFKHSRKLLLKRFSLLNDEQKQQVNVMLYASPSISTAHFYKEDFMKILECTNRETAKQYMAEWLESAQNCGLIPFEKCAKTLHTWMTGILNSFSVPYTNGFTEGCNNKIKVLKRNAYGYKSFSRFRNRILHMFSHQKYQKMVTA